MTSIEINLGRDEFKARFDALNELTVELTGFNTFNDLVNAQNAWCPENGSGISTHEPMPGHYEDQEDFEFAWKEWAAEYPTLARQALQSRVEY
jgi:hypothetical protein